MEKTFFVIPQGHPSLSFYDTVFTYSLIEAHL